MLSSCVLSSSLLDSYSSIASSVSFFFRDLVGYCLS